MHILKSSVLFRQIDRLHLTAFIRCAPWKKLVGKGGYGRHAARDVIVWEAKQFDDGPHRHIGFFVGGSQAVSTSSVKKVVHQHEAASADGRAIEAVYRWTKRQD